VPIRPTGQWLQAPIAAAAAATEDSPQNSANKLAPELAARRGASRSLPLTSQVSRERRHAAQFVVEGRCDRSKASRALMVALFAGWRGRCQQGELARLNFFPCSSPQYFVSRFAINCLLVVAGKHRGI